MNYVYTYDLMKMFCENDNGNENDIDKENDNIEDAKPKSCHCPTVMILNHSNASK